MLESRVAPAPQAREILGLRRRLASRCKVKGRRPGRSHNPARAAVRNCVTQSDQAAICFAIIVGVLMLGRHLGKLALTVDQPTQTIGLAVYYLLPHLEFYDLRDLIIHDWPLVNWGVAGFAALYGVVYAGLFLSLACLLFRRKPLNA